MVKKIREWHISDFIKSDEDVHKLLAAEREPYEKALSAALKALDNVYFILDEVLVPGDTNQIDRLVDFLQRTLRTIRNELDKEGIPDPTETKDAQCGKSTLE